MQVPFPFYPLKIKSRSLPVARTNKLRLSWFFLGLLAGVGLTIGFSSGIHLPSFRFQQEQAIGPHQPTPEEIALLELINKEGTPNVIDADSDSLYPLTLILKIENGDTLINLLTDAGVSTEDAHNMVKAIGKAFNVKRLDIGQNVTVEIDKSNVDGSKPVIRSVLLPTSATASLEITRNAKNDFDIKKLQVPVERKLLRVSGKIDSSLYETAVAQGMPPALLADMIGGFSYDVDFQRDIQRGDKITALYERMETKDGIVAGYGNVVFADLDLGERKLKIYRYADKSGNADYYNAKGESVRKALLRTPINGAKITSGFGMRNHPILGYSKMHRGVDFGAPTGTPIYAAGDGKVDFLGQKGGYGKYLRVRHSNAYATAYAHISRFAKGVSVGSKVRQGQIVAYVGMSGMATGPHLHYEVLVGNDQVNPSKVKFKTGNVLGGKELASFRKNVEFIESQLAAPQAQTAADLAAMAQASPSAGR